MQRGSLERARVAPELVTLTTTAVITQLERTTSAHRCGRRVIFQMLIPNRMDHHERPWELERSLVVFILETLPRRAACAGKLIHVIPGLNEARKQFAFINHEITRR